MIVHISGINPEPWTAPEVSVGRKGGKVYPMVYKSETLRAYQEAIKDALSDDIPEPVVTDKEPFSLKFYFWRQLPSYEIADGRRSRRHIADTTNLQKALEDALQKVLFKNDRWCLSIQSHIVEQDADTVPGIVIEIMPMVGNPIPNSTIQSTRLKILKESEQERPADDRAGLDAEELF